MADQQTEITGHRYGWIRCETCGGTGTVRHFRGTSAMVNHLARGGDPTRLPCGDCGGNGRSWGILPADGR